MIQALALAAVNAGWTLEHLLWALLDANHTAGDKIRRLQMDEAQRYIGLAWSKALRRADRRPPVLNGDDAATEITMLAAAAQSFQWRGRAGGPGRAVRLGAAG